MKPGIATVGLFAAGTLLAGCDRESPTFTADDGDTESETGSDTDTGQDTDTAEEDIPPDLPAACVVDSTSVPLSGGGDGRWPTLARGEGEMLLAWAYDGQQGSADWNIQVATHEAGIPPLIGQPDEPVAWSILSQKPAMAARGDLFGLVWLDSRWDPDCQADDQQACLREPAFIELTADGSPAGDADPVRLTAGESIAVRPVIAATDSGWIAVWSQDQTGNAATIEAVAIDGTGQPGAVHVVSGVDAAAKSYRPALAAAGEQALVVWLDAGYQSISAIRLGPDGAPLGGIQPVVEGNSVVHPRLAAGDGEFLLTYGRPQGADIEIRARRLDTAGGPLGGEQRVTWTSGDTIFSHPAWSGSEWAVAWLSDRANGADECAVETCQAQVFLTALDADGAPRAAEVQLSADANPASEIELSWSGTGWLALFELRRNLRQQVSWSHAFCERAGEGTAPGRDR